MCETYPALSTSTNVCEDSVLSVLEYDLPGFGSQHSDKCNQVNFVSYCPDCNDTDLHYYHCNRWDCPVCYKWTANKRARESTNRLFGVKIAWNTAGEDIGFVNHIVISAPPVDIAFFNEAAETKKMIKYAKEIGLSGGLHVFHPYRIKDDLEYIIEFARRNGDFEGGNWDAVRQDILGLGPLSAYVEFGPHWHLIGFFKLKERSDVFYKRTGWTYKNVSWEKYHEALDKDGARRTLSYLCTHHAYRKGKQSVRYFGVAAPNKVSRTITREYLVAKCPKCSHIPGQVDLNGASLADPSKGDLYRLPVNSSLHAERLIESINLGNFRFDPDRYKKCRYTVTHSFYSVKTKSSKREKSVEVIDNDLENVFNSSSPPPITWATEEEIQARRDYESSLPAIDWGHVSRLRIG